MRSEDFHRMVGFYSDKKGIRATIAREIMRPLVGVYDTLVAAHHLDMAEDVMAEAFFVYANWPAQRKVLRSRRATPRKITREEISEIFDKFNRGQLTFPNDTWMWDGSRYVNIDGGLHLRTMCSTLESVRTTITFSGRSDLVVRFATFYGHEFGLVCWPIGNR